jgi:hypothetical protein
MFMVENYIDVGTDEEDEDDDKNYYEDLDEDILSGLLGLTEMLALN